MKFGKTVHRFRWLILLAWVVCAGVLVVTVPPVDPQANEAASFLPADSPSRQAVEAIWKSFPDAVGLSEAMVVFERRGGPLTDDDLRVVEDVAGRLRQAIDSQQRLRQLGAAVVRSPASVVIPSVPLVGRPIAPNPLVSARTDRGQAALIVVNIPANFITLHSAAVVGRIRDLLAETGLPAGLSAAVTGSSGFGHDYAVAAENSHRNTFYVTLAAVIVILLLVYRAPMAAAVPLVAISLAVVVAMRLLAIGGHFGLHVGTAEKIFVFVLIYGAGTDYSLLLISRYREGLGRAGSAPPSPAEALDATSAPIFASAGTDAAGLLMLVFAQYAIFRTTGPAVALSLLVALLAAVTLVPAILGIIGPRVFWPRKPARLSGARRLWVRTAGLVTARPALVLVGTLAVLAAPACRGANLKWVYDALAVLKHNDGEKVGNAAMGVDMARRHWPVGHVAPVSVLVRTSEAMGRGACERLSQRLSRAVRGVDGVEDIRSFSWPLGGKLDPLANTAIRTLGGAKVRAEYISADGRSIRLVAMLAAPSMSLRAMDIVGRIRQSAAAVAGAEVFVAGATAEMIDIRRVTGGDFRRIAPLTLVVIFLMVLMLLRNVILSAFMVASTVLSYLATLGIAHWVFVSVGGCGGLDWKVEVFLFVVIAAVGVDYNIFLASRIAEEARRLPYVQAVRQAVIHTGPVISSCGLIMAATLGSLMAGELVLLQQLGFALALGMLIDTFIVRPLLLPAFVVLTRPRAGGRD